jgi:hypothetical protein
MTRKVYKSAMGKEVDLGALLLQNEHVRAVGNMNVNARGDLLDGANQVIEQKNRQVQRQYRKTTLSSQLPVHSSNVEAKRASEIQTEEEDSIELDLSELDVPVLSEPEPVTAPEPLPENTFAPTGEGGLAAAIARSRTIKQEKEKTFREKQQSQGLRKI